MIARSLIILVLLGVLPASEASASLIVSAPVDVIGSLPLSEFTGSGYGTRAYKDWGNEPSVAVDPSTPNNIVISSFSFGTLSSGRGANIFYSTTGGSSWTSQFSVPAPAAGIGIPNDWRFLYDDGGVLHGGVLGEAMPPFQGGGDMIKAVTFEKTVYNDLPYKFEAGTPDVAGAIGLGAALEYLDGLGRDRAAAYEHDLLAYGTERLSAIPGVRLIGTAREKASVLSFVMEGAHAHDVGTILDREGIAVRTGHHCAMPVMTRFGLAATTRASVALYNTREELDALCAGLGKVREIFG